MNNSRDFYAGIVVALDVVAGFDMGTIFKEIAQEVGKDIGELEKEVMENGLQATKLMWQIEIVGERGS